MKFTFDFSWKEYKVTVVANYVWGVEMLIGPLKYDMLYYVLENIDAGAVSFDRHKLDMAFAPQCSTEDYQLAIRSLIDEGYIERASSQAFRLTGKPPETGEFWSLLEWIRDALRKASANRG